METKINEKWIELSSLPDSSTFVSGLININGNEFVAISNTDYIFNIKTNKFKSFVELGYPKIEANKLSANQISFDAKNDKLYYRSKSNSNSHLVHSVNLATKKHEIFHGFPGFTYGIYFLFVNNHFHIIHNNNKHWIGTMQNKTVQPIHNTLSNTPRNLRRFGKAIFIPSKQCIVLIGGFDFGECVIDLWMYSLITQKWTKINNITFKGFVLGAVLTSNQRYIVLMGGKTGQACQFTCKNNISVIDMKDNNNWKMKQSTILCPKKGNCHITRTGGIDSKDKLLVIGYIKKCFNKAAFQHLTLPPIYIIMIIVKWFSAEMIHWMHSQGADTHYGIYLKDILSSLTEK